MKSIQVSPMDFYFCYFFFLHQEGGLFLFLHSLPLRDLSLFHTFWLLCNIEDLLFTCYCHKWIAPFGLLFHKSWVLWISRGRLLLLAQPGPTALAWIRHFLFWRRDWPLPQPWAPCRAQNVLWFAHGVWFSGQCNQTLGWCKETVSRIYSP